MSKAVARVFFDRARQDLNAAAALAETDPDLVGDDVVGFHIQQAVEKSAKALLAWNQIEFKHTHEIDKIFHAVASDVMPIPERFQELEELTPFAVAARYGLSEPISINRKELIALASNFLKWVASSMKNAR